MNADLDLLKRLEVLSRDLVWTWLEEGPAFWSVFSPEGFAQPPHNPAALLAAMAPEEQLRRAHASMAELLSLETRRAAYLSKMGLDTWHDLVGRPLRGPVAYFSAEFGLHESLPTYSGGLGILAGDHTKSASDLGLPFVGIGLLYRQGYVRQEIDAKGQQQNVYEDFDFATLPISPARALDGGPQLEVLVEMGDETVKCRVFRVVVGRVSLLLLDTDVEGNAPEQRRITQRLYGGDHQTRIRQELVLAIGGLQALCALGIEPQVFHLNEGHSAFLVLERARMALSEGRARDVAEALSLGRRSSVFTTHTPVEAGHDRFDAELLWRHLRPMAEVLGLSRAALLALGHWHDERDAEAPFNMTMLALHACGRYNGVAALHGVVSREMFARFFPGTPVDEVPVRHVTNGVHAPSWQCPELVAMLEQVAPEAFRNRPAGDPGWNAVYDLDDAELWRWRTRNKTALFSLIKARETARAARLSRPPPPLELSTDALTIGFARRFATYKRATLLFSDLPRLEGLLERAPGPIQFLFAGKAHPADHPGQSFIQEVTRLAERFEGRVRFIEGYDIELGRALTRGVDVWLNNPRRPMEASGTSGMKAAMNGVLNLSILDGWWPEGFDGENGWAIGEARVYSTEAEQDAADAASLHHLLEHAVLPTYYTRDALGLPRGWMKMMKRSIATLTPRFSSDRQVQDYVHHIYCPG